MSGAEIIAGFVFLAVFALVFLGGLLLTGGEK